MSPSKVLPWLLALSVFVAGLFAVWHFFPRVETKTETVVVTDSAAVQIQAIVIDSLSGVIDSMKVERQRFASKHKKKIADAIAFYRALIVELQAKKDSVSIPKANAEQNWITTAAVRTTWTDGEGQVNARDTTIHLYGITHAQYTFPPVNQFTLLTEVNEIQIPYPMLRTTTIRTESRISWEWIVAGIAVGVAAGALLTKK